VAVRGELELADGRTERCSTQAITGPAETALRLLTLATSCWPRRSSRTGSDR
jgi:hypothetical protein